MFSPDTFPRLWLGPMAGYSDSPLRALCHRYGADASVSEMISAKALVFRDKKTKPLGCIREGEGPVSVQIFGSDPSVLAEAAVMLAEGYCGGLPPFAIDINMGCPMPKITGNGEGSALLRDPELCYRIASAVSKALKPKEMPLTAKIRLGWSKDERRGGEVAEALEAGGVAALFVHGRTRAEMYAGEADAEAIRAIRERVRSIPVVANGDIRDGKSALALRERSGCDCLMIARGAVGNPFLFREVKAALASLPYEGPSDFERIEAAKEQLCMATALYGEERGVLESRKQLASYISGVRGAASLRALINTAKTQEEILEAFDKFLLQSN